MKTLTRLSAAALLVLAPVGVAAAQSSAPAESNKQSTTGDEKTQINPQGATGQEAITNSGGPGAGQGKRRGNTMPDQYAGESDKPPLELTEQQRGAIRQAVAKEDTHQKTPANYQPKVGEPITSAMKPHPLPRPLVNEQAVLKQYTYVKMDQNIVLVDPMSMKVAAIIPHQSPTATTLPKTPIEWAATRGRELLGLPPETGDAAKAGAGTAAKDAAAAAKDAAAAAEKAAAAAKEAAEKAEKAATASQPAASAKTETTRTETTGQPPAAESKDNTATESKPSDQPPATGDTPPAGGGPDQGNRQ